MASINKCKLTRQTCSWVFSQSKHVMFNKDLVEQLAKKFNYTPFNDFQHHNLKEDNEHSLQYIFVLDCLNFCFWPLEKFEYEHLANSVKQFILKNKGISTLRNINEETVINQIFSGVRVPLADERARILRQMSNVVFEKFEGSVKKVVESANKSAVNLLNILTQNFPNFQDHSIYQGHQVHFYKRPQILIGDIYAKYQGKGLGEFNDIDQLTMFPDYRVPQILNHYKILEYSSQLKQKIENRIPISSGSEQQIQIRAASVVAVEYIKQLLQKMLQKNVNSIEVDWFLWEQGEKSLSEIVNHHRTLTIYY